MSQNNLFVALVTFDPDTPSHRSYTVKPLDPAIHGKDIPAIVVHFSDSAHAGWVFEAVDQVDAEVTVNEHMPHPADVGGFAYMPNTQMRGNPATHDFV